MLVNFLCLLAAGRIPRSETLKSSMQPNKSTGRRPTRSALRASLLLPVLITLGIWLAGAVVLVLFPTAFNAVLAGVVGVSLALYLIYWTRHERRSLQITAVLFALPALAGIAWGLISGQARYTLIGVGVTFVLLVAQRVLNTPLSFRAALRHFNSGDVDQALQLINKSIEARPDFWESYQLRALIHLSKLNFARAERDAKTAVSRRPEAHPVYNTLGQVYLAQERFAAAEEAYVQAVELAPDNDLYRYHLGLSRYRQEKYRPAAEALAAATQGALPRAMHDLAAHYYLGRCLEALGEADAAAEAYAEMAHFRRGLATWRRQLRDQPPYPHLAQMRADVADMAVRLAVGEEEE